MDLSVEGLSRVLQSLTVCDQALASAAGAVCSAAHILQPVQHQLQCGRPS